MFQRILRLSMKCKLLLALSPPVVALAFLLAGWQQPEERGIRFRYPDSWDSGYFSLDEPKIIDLFHLDLSAFEFPPDFPLTIARSTLYLKAAFGTGNILVPTDFSLSHNCSPSPDLKKLLCGSPANADILDLPEEQQDAAIGALQEHLVSHPGFFVITPGIPQIYVIPEGSCRNCDFDYKTGCHWASDTRIYCTSSHGTGIWETSLFDLDSHSYVELPHNGENIWGYSPFAKGYIYLQTFPHLYRFVVYNLARAIVYQGAVEDWTASEDTVVFVGPGDNQSYCASKLELDDRGLKTSRQQVLDTSWFPGTTESHSVETREEYLVTSNGKVFILSKATLQVKRTLEYPEAELQRHEPPIALYRDNDLLVTADYAFWGIERSRVTAFDLNECRGRLDNSCKLQTWDSVWTADLDDTLHMHDWHRVYYSPTERPDLILSIDQDSRRLTITNLKNWTDYDFELAFLPDVAMISTDGHYFFISTRVGDETSAQYARYHLFDLWTMHPDTREIVMGKNLFFISGDTR